MREALQLHTSVVERGQSIQSVVRTITCRDQDREVPLVDLSPDNCVKERQINQAGRSQSHVVLIVLTVIASKLLSGQTTCEL